MATSPFLRPEMTDGEDPTNASFCFGEVFHSSCAACTQANSITHVLTKHNKRTPKHNPIKRVKSLRDV